MKKILIALLLIPTILFSAENSFDRLNPIGTTINFAGPNCPQGYLLMDGSAVSRITYSKLLAAIGTANGGVGNGTTTFNLPNTITNIFTPTGTWTTNTTYSGVWIRDGKFMDIKYSVTTSGAPTAAALTVGIPATYTMDIAGNYPPFGSIKVGDGYAIDVGVIRNVVAVDFATSTTLSLYPYDASATYERILNNVNATIPFTFGSGDGITFNARVPILGWTNISGNCIKY